jgi:hypothetical protein
MATKWDDQGMSQEDFMLKDECILCDENDRVVGHGSKKDAHIFNPEQVDELFPFFICIVC